VNEDNRTQFSKLCSFFPSSDFFHAFVVELKYLKEKKKLIIVVIQKLATAVERYKRGE